MKNLEFLRSFRIGQFAIFDFVVSYLAIFLLAPFLSKIALKFGLTVSLRQWLFLTLPFSILVHILVGQMTPLTKMFLNYQDYYSIKIIILLMIFLGFGGDNLIESIIKKFFKI